MKIKLFKMVNFEKIKRDSKKIVLQNNKKRLNRINEKYNDKKWVLKSTIKNTIK